MGKTTTQRLYSLFAFWKTFFHCKQFCVYLKEIFLKEHAYKLQCTVNCTESCEADITNTNTVNYYICYAVECSLKQQRTDHSQNLSPSNDKICLNVINLV